MKIPTKKDIELIAVYSKKNSRKRGEVFTPFSLIEEMVSRIPREHLSDPSKTFLDPAAGLGNFPVVLMHKLMAGLQDYFPVEQDRYRHIMQNQIFMVEIDRNNCDCINRLFNSSGDIKLNILCGDALTSDVARYFAAPWDLRYIYYPSISYYRNGDVIVMGDTEKFG